MTPLVLSAQLAAISTLILLLICTPLAWGLAKTKSRAKPALEALFALPLVLPPTVLGFYLLIFLNPESALGGWWLEITGETLVFNFTGLVIGSVIYSLPFVLRPIQNSFEAVPDTLLEAAATLNAGAWDRFRTIVLPLAKPGYISAAVLGFAHTLGEFGVVLMIGGNIPNQTRTVSIAIYDHVEQLDYAAAHALSVWLLAGAFIMLLALFSVNQKRSLL